MRRYGLPLVLFLSLVPTLFARQKGGEDETGEYIPAPGWPAPFARPGYIQGVQTGIFAESPNRIFIMNRGELKLPYIMIRADQYAWVVDGTTNRFFKYDLNGKMLYAWGVYGYFPGGMWGPHQFSVDSDGNVYVAEAWSGRSQKFIPKPGADRSKLISAPIQFSNK